MEPWGIQTKEHVSLNGLHFDTVEYTPGHWAERHAHEIGFVDLILSGAQDGRWAGEDVRRSPGTLAVMPPGEAHATSSVLPTRTFQIAVEPSWSGFSGARRPLAGPCSHVEIGPIAWGMTGMWAEFRRRDDLTLLILEGRFHLFLDGLNNESVRYDDGKTRWLKQAHDYVRAYARERFAVSDLATEIGVAPAHLMRTYARHYGVTVGDDVRRQRVTHACRLLTAPSPSLGEVAMMAGFADQSHLNRIFKRHTGLTPLEYRTTVLGR